MSKIYIHSGLVLNSDTETFERKNIVIEDGIVSALSDRDILPSDYDEIISADGKLITPSYIDIHTHGAKKLKFQGQTREQYVEMMSHYTDTGTASVFPTISTDTYDEILKATETLCSLAREYDGINIDCIHFEGPFLSHARKGAHNADFLRLPDIEFVKKALKITGKDIKLRITVAPELCGAMEFIKECKALGVMTAIGHTDTDFETAKRAVELGANSFIHTFNAMSPLGHREPGVVGAAMYCKDGWPELICDGFHVDKAAASILYHARPDNLVLVSDSIQAAGLPDIEGYTFKSAGMDVIITGGQARLSDGTIAGSRLDMHRAVLNLSEFADIPVERAIICATKHPALLCGLYGKTGSIEAGKRADINILNGNFSLEGVFVKGRRVK